MDQKFWSSEKIVSLSAMMISLLTLIVFVYQTNLIRKQQFMSVYPHLDLYNTNSGSLAYKFVLENKGVGPAFIKKITIQDSLGNKYETMTDYLLTKLSIKDSLSISNSDIYEGLLISAGDVINLFQLTDPKQLISLGIPPNTIKGANKLRAILNDDAAWRLTIVYESIYGEQWSINKEGAIPRKIK